MSDQISAEHLATSRAHNLLNLNVYDLFSFRTRDGYICTIFGAQPAAVTKALVYSGMAIIPQQS